MACSKKRALLKVKMRPLETRVLYGVKLYRFDWVIFATTILLCAVGLVNLYSATYASQFKSYFANQLYTSVAGVVLAFILALFPTKFIKQASYLLLGALVASLFLVLFIGPEIHGAKRWLTIGGIGLQPSEFGKLALILALARYFADYPKARGYALKRLWLPMSVTLLCSALIILEPDLGTAGLYILVFAAISLIAGVRKKLLILAIITALVAIPLAWKFGLEDYQRERVLTLVNPERDPLGSGYHIRQSIIAIGSGQAFGKSYLDGTQTKLQFLPEHHTDFIFAVLAEEWGFFGSLFVILAFAYLIYRIFTLATLVPDRFRRFALAGIGFYFFFQVAINIAMTLGIFPVVGVTLPFFSYGRSSLVTSFAAIGLAINFASKRYMFED